MSNLRSLNLENPWLIVPLILTCWGIFFLIKSQGRSLNQHTASMGIRMDSHDISWPRVAEDRQPWKEARLKAEFPQSHGGGWKMRFSFSNCTRATSDGEFSFGSSFFKFFEGYIRISKASIFPISVCFCFPPCFLLDPSNCDARSMYWFAPVASHNFSFITWALFDGSNGAKYNL